MDEGVKVFADESEVGTGMDLVAVCRGVIRVDL